MTQDEIIRMAREAGFARYMTDGEINWQMFERFAALVAKAVAFARSNAFDADDYDVVYADEFVNDINEVE